MKYGERFTFVNERVEYDGVIGFRTYNSMGDEVGIVWMTDDVRTPAYEHCEMFIYLEYRHRYGMWHRIKSFGKRIPWDFLCDKLETNGSYELYID